ncbi:RagB/SusD family nutrient uptake outer membrane protein [Leeuwenhoekiella sp. NPDC079379]|uniref:RagB/SusD family nutrient uptake outer membrane protein n=1 Tax=Leeuwenhoekiella sp. NPDC079379 TaxID=3364122 RepID=UPI0037C8765D
MKLYFNYINVLAVCLLIGFTSCTFDELADPNGPSVNGVEQGASIGQLNELLIGVESTLRLGHGTEILTTGVMAREFYLFNADPRNTGDLLGKDGIGLDNNTFYSTTQWNGNYRCIKNAQLLISAVQNTETVTDQERNGYLGFAKTAQAYEYIQLLKSYGKARLDVTDPENLGPILDFDPALAAVRTLIDEANQDLANAGTNFLFTLSSGFAGFDDVASFRKFNRALAAITAVYDGDGVAALTALDESFLDLNGALDMGPKHVFGASGNDLLNGVFRVPSTVETPNNGDQVIVHNSFIADAEAGDLRVIAKTVLRPDPTNQDGLNGTHESILYDSQLSPIDIVSNEELILIYAEASILANELEDAEDALNIIRDEAGGLDDYAGATTAAALTSELLKQRRYSLFSENHRMFDLRRYNLSSLLSIDRTGDQIYNVLPIPAAENE